jgi:hypothetical protein
MEPTVWGIGSGLEGTQLVIKMRNVKGHAKDTREIVSYHYHYCAGLRVYNKLIVMILSYLENFHMFADGATIEEAVEAAKQTASRHIKFVKFDVFLMPFRPARNPQLHFYCSNEHNDASTCLTMI